MPNHFDLVITANNANRTVDLRLLNDSGAQIAYRHGDLNANSASELQGLFDRRNFERLYVKPNQQATAIANVGVCIAEKLLGSDILTLLWKTTTPRTLRIQLPEATNQENFLAAALAGVPSETARLSANQPSLAVKSSSSTSFTITPSRKRSHRIPGKRAPCASCSFLLKPRGQRRLARAKHGPIVASLFDLRLPILAASCKCRPGTISQPWRSCGGTNAKSAESFPNERGFAR